MSRARIAALFAVLACLLAVPATATAGTSPVKLMLKKVNAYRHAHGVGKVRMNRSLMRSAGRYSRHMMRTKYFGHASHIHASSRFRTLGEIIEIHRGGAGVRTAFRAWVHSPPHRSVMLMRQFKMAGAGYVTGRWHGRRCTIWTMHFGRK